MEPFYPRRARPGPGPHNLCNTRQTQSPRNVTNLLRSLTVALLYRGCCCKCVFFCCRCVFFCYGCVFFCCECVSWRDQCNSCTARTWCESRDVKRYREQERRRRVWHTATLRQHASIQGQLLRRTVEWFRGGLEFKARRPLYHSTLGTRVIKKRKKV